MKTRTKSASDELASPLKTAKPRLNGRGKLAALDIPGMEELGAAANRKAETITIPAIRIQFCEIILEGDSAYICHAWSAKARTMILDKQQKKARQGREIKNPEQDFKDSLYPMPSGKGYGMPASALKQAAVDACSFIGGITKVVARGAFHVMGDLLPVDGTPTMREDMVRVGMGTADIRYRGEFKKWRVRVPISYNATVLSPAQIINLFNVAGFAVGVGDWRPQTNGNHGMFHVVLGEEAR